MHPKGTHNVKLYHIVQKQLITYYLWYFADVAAYLLKKVAKK